jgi:hypothetical protein
VIQVRVPAEEKDLAIDPDGSAIWVLAGQEKHHLVKRLQRLSGLCGSGEFRLDTAKAEADILG